MRQKHIAVLVLLLSVFSARFANAQTTPDPVYLKKTLTHTGGNNYHLSLESFVSGTNVASDIAIIMDFSGTMNAGVTGTGTTYSREKSLTEEDNITATVKGKTTTVKNMTASAKGKTANEKNMKATAKALKANAKVMKATVRARKTNNERSTRTNWSYTNLSTYHFPFYLYEGQYYRVQRGNNLGPNGNIRALWIDTPDGRKYLSGSGISSTDYGTVTTDGGTIYSGTLYAGYTWSSIATGNTAGETPMTYLYNGEYYPVKRNRFNADGTRNDSGNLYALWIDTPDGVKFLHGGGLQNLPDQEVTANSIYIFCGDLYDSGWTYALINGPFYYNHGGVYYPVHKKLENGTYSLFIEVGGNTLYLNGEGVSDHPVASVYADNQSIFFGSLYNGGWSHNDVGADESAYSYLYEGKYYPVKRGRFNADGTPNNTSGSVYAIYIELGGVKKFLSGNGFQDKPYELVTTTGTTATCSIFSGTLYSGGWTYADITGPYYYMHNDVLYPVHKGPDTAGGPFYLYVEIGGVTKYLNGEGLSDSYEPSVKANSQNIFFGSLYNGGWTYNNIAADESTYTYLHEGNYYPVKRGRFNADGTPNNTSGSVYAIYIELGGVKKFLSGNGFQDKPYELVTTGGTAATNSIFSGTLYSGGWTYAAINGPFYYMHNGVLYPVHKGPATAGGPFYLYVEIGGVTKYLNGEGLSDSYEPSVKANSQNIFFGSLYNGGWTYDNIAADESTYTYLHEGKYYPVKRGRFNADGTPNNTSGSVYAIYIELGGVKQFLSGNGLQDSPYELVTTGGTAATNSIFSGTLYSGGWTCALITSDNTYFYLLDGVYYPVKRSDSMSDGQGNNNVRALWIELTGGTRKYLSGDGLADDYIRSFRTNTQGLFYGKLYSGGWSYTSLNYGDATGKVANQWYYRDSEGKYYPVRRSKTEGGGSVRAMWICPDPNNTSSRKYLSGQGLADSPDLSITGDDQVIYLGPLYKGWTYTTGNGMYYKHTDDQYYQVSQVSQDGNQLSVTIGGTPYFLNGHTISTSPNPYASNNNDISLYFEDLYYKRDQKRKGDFLIDAVNALVDGLAEDAVADDLHHRVALISFNYAHWYNGSGSSSKPHLEAFPLSTSNSHVVNDFMDVTVPANVTAMKNAMAPPRTIAGESYYDWGMSLAKGLFERELGSESGYDFNDDGTTEEYEVPTLSGNEHATYPTRPKIVVIIGDCIPTNRANAKTAAESLRNNLNAKIFVVYVNTSDTYYDRAQEWASSDDMITRVENFDSELVTKLRELKDDIRKAAIELGTDSVVQDVIADGFIIPDESTSVKVRVADYLSGKEKELMEFGPARDTTLTPVFFTDENGRRAVSVSGFDYSENYCGTVSGKKRGKKVIIEIDVERTTAVGGPATLTNAEGSGMKFSQNGAFVASFDNPTLAMPVNIQIQKEGLASGESAVFTVQPVNADGDPISSISGTPVKPIRLILTGNSAGTPVTASLKNLNENCYWKVTEEGWAWNYETNGGNPSLSSMTTLVNPFLFVNVKQGTIIKSAESKVTNDYSGKTSVTVNSRDQ